MPVEELIEQLPAGGRAALAGLLRHQEAHAHERRLHPRALGATSSSAAARPWVDPVAGEWAPGAWLDPDTGAPVVRRAAVAARALRRRGLRRDGAGGAGAGGTVLGEVPALVDFLFLADPPIDEDSWQKAIAARRGGARDPGGGARPPTRRASGTRTRCTR